MRMKIVALAAALAALFMVTGCGPDTSGDGQKQESATGQSNYDAQVKNQPAHNMPYSNSRDTINFYIDTWGKKGAQAYTYLMNDSGEAIGYYVTVGPPVTMCASLRPNYKVITPEIPGDNAVPLVVPAPGTDGVYYSGGQCNTYYAKDAVNGTFIEFTVGNGMNMLTYNQPLAPGIVGGAPNLGEVKK